MLACRFAPTINVARLALKSVDFNQGVEACLPLSGVPQKLKKLRFQSSPNSGTDSTRSSPTSTLGMEQSLNQAYRQQRTTIFATITVYSMDNFHLYSLTNSTSAGRSHWYSNRGAAKLWWMSLEFPQWKKVENHWPKSKWKCIHERHGIRCSKSTIKPLAVSWIHEAICVKPLWCG